MDLFGIKTEKCLKEKCIYYKPYCEASYDGCMYGALEGDDDIVAPCMEDGLDAISSR